jgi:hypothetical protein
MIVSVMAIGAADDVLRRSEYARDVINRYTKLQKHRGTGVPKDVRRYVDAKFGKLAGCSPGSAFLGLDRAACVFDHVGCRKAPPATKVRKQPRRYWDGRSTLVRFYGA